MTTSVRNARMVNISHLPKSKTKNKNEMADINKQADEWLRDHPKATPREIWLAGYWQSTDNWCSRKR